MNQTLRIFCKDCRRFWPEALAVWTLSLTFAWMYPYTWTERLDHPVKVSHSLFDDSHLRVLAYTVLTLLILGWFLLVARVVHAENLIGTRHFWLTRPYRRTHLLGAKLLFLLAHVYLPLAVAQMLMLLHAGLPAAPAIPSLLFDLLGLSAVLILPLFAFAAVTSALIRMILTLLAIAAAVAVAAFVSSSHASAPGIELPIQEDVSLYFMLAISAATLTVAYLTRRVWVARGLLCMLLVLVAVMVASPFQWQLFTTLYPPAAPEVTRHLKITPARHAIEIHGWVDASSLHEELLVVFPTLTGAEAYSIENVHTVISTADGSMWKSPWEATFNLNVAGDKPTAILPMTFTGTMPQSMRRLPLHYHIELAVAEMRAEPPVDMHMPKQGGSLLIPGLGRCLLPAEETANGYHWDCRVAYHQPQLTEITVGVTKGPCGGKPSPGGVFRTWTGTLEHDPADPYLNSVRQLPIGFNVFGLQDGTSDSICEGSPVRFVRFHKVRRFRFELDLDTTPFRTDKDGTGEISPKKVS